MFMVWFWTRGILTLINMVLDAIRWDIGNASLKNEVPLTVVVLVGALLGALVAGLFGAAVGGVIAAVLWEIYKGKEAARVY